MGPVGFEPCRQVDSVIFEICLIKAELAKVSLTMT